MTSQNVRWKYTTRLFFDVVIDEVWTRRASYSHIQCQVQTKRQISIDLLTNSSCCFCLMQHRKFTFPLQLYRFQLIGLLSGLKIRPRCCLGSVVEIFFYFFHRVDLSVFIQVYFKTVNRTRAIPVKRIGVKQFWKYLHTGVCSLTRNL